MSMMFMIFFQNLNLFGLQRKRNVTSKLNQQIQAVSMNQNGSVGLPCVTSVALADALDDVGGLGFLIESTVSRQKHMIERRITDTETMAMTRAAGELSGYLHL